MNNKEHNFVSAVVYIGGDDRRNITFLETLHKELDVHFLQYEIIGVIPDSHYKSEAIRQWAARVEKPVTMLTMSLHQPQEQCMNAGLDISIGDYVYEFDTTEMPYEAGLIWDAYETAMQGNDIVAVCPGKTRNKLFYNVFNRYSRTEQDICTDVFRLVSRRALNRVHAMNENLPYRKAAYAACGLKMAQLTFNGQLAEKKEAPFRLAIDSLVLYTDFAYRLGIGLTLAMLVATLSELVYTLIVWLTGNPISGWTTTMFVLTLSMTGLFAVSAIVMKYLTLLVRLSFEKQNYLVESIEKM